MTVLATEVGFKDPPTAIRLEFREVHYRIRGVPTHRWRMLVDVNDHHLGQINGSHAHICAVLSSIEAGARMHALTLDIINDPRSHRHIESSKL